MDPNGNIQCRLVSQMLSSQLFLCYIASHFVPIVPVLASHLYSGYFVLLSCIVVAVTLYVCRNISKNAEKNNKSHQKIKEDG